MAKRIAEELVREYERVQEEICEEIRGLQDYTDIRNKIIEKCIDKAAANRMYQFFYDESNNYRAFRMKNGKFNEAPENYFVLGGVCTKMNAFWNFEQLETQLSLQSNHGELKSKKWYQGKDFFWCMNDKHLNVILKWIDQNNIFLHAEAIDHFKFIATELSKICCGNQAEGERLICENTFYNCMKSDIEGIQKIFVRYNYPDIDAIKLIDFLEEFRNFVLSLSEKKLIDEIDKLGKKIFWDIPIKATDRAISSNSSLERRKDIINNYTRYYIIKPIIFLSSQHTYDDEVKIDEKLKVDRFMVEGEELTNYCFVNSVDEKMIQISDIIVAVLARFFKYVNSFEIGEKTVYSINIGNCETSSQS